MGLPVGTRPPADTRPPVPGWVRSQPGGGRPHRAGKTHLYWAGAWGCRELPADCSSVLTAALWLAPHCPSSGLRCQFTRGWQDHCPWQRDQELTERG